jgi:hypothetical protein
MSTSIEINILRTPRIRFSGSSSGDTVTYSVIGPDGVIFSSGSASWVNDEWWEFSFTPNLSGNYDVEIDNTTLDTQKSLSFHVEVLVIPQANSKVFTSWSSLLAQLENQLINFKPGLQSYSIAGRSVTYSTFDEFKKMYDFVRSRAMQEAGNFRRRRTLVKNGDSGLW